MEYDTSAFHEAKRRREAIRAELASRAAVMVPEGDAAKLIAQVAAFIRDTAHLTTTKANPKLATIAEVHAWWLPKMADPANSCWSCSYTGDCIERSHIVAKRLGGTTAPTNFLILCTLCHRAILNDLCSIEEQVEMVLGRVP